MTQPLRAIRWLEARSAWQRLALSAIAGALAGLGQAPFGLWYLALPGFAGLLLLTSLCQTPARAAVTAWIGAAAMFAVALHWIVEPFLVDAPRHGWMAPFALVLMSGGLALFWAVPGWVMGRLVPIGATVWRIAALVGVLILAEAARGTVLTGFPWAYPGHILIDTPLLTVSRLAGAHGLTVLVLGCAAVFAMLFLRFGAMSVLPMAAPLLAVFVVAQTSAAPSPDADGPIVRLVQPNAPQHLKWRPDMIPVFFQRALDLSSAEADGPAPDLIIWPETALPELLGRSDAARARIAAAGGDAAVLLGGQRYEGLRPRNTAALLDSDGRILQVYDKHHLVPFGEYMPLGDLADRLGLNGLAETLSGGYAPGAGPGVFDLGDGLGRAFPMICYEAIFPSYIRQVERPDWMVHLTNDAWFGEFSGPYQHLAMARLRAAEQGLPVLRAANTGVSAVIDGYGRIVASLALGEAGYLDARLPPALPPTLYARTGDLPLLLIVLLATALAVATSRRADPLNPAS